VARLLDDYTGNERLISWLRVMFPEAMEQSVLRPTRDSHERPVDSKTLGAGSRNTPYGMLLHFFSRIRSRSPENRTSQ
jgi:hypothetical protein